MERMTLERVVGGVEVMRAVGRKESQPCLPCSQPPASCEVKVNGSGHVNPLAIGNP